MSRPEAEPWWESAFGAEYLSVYAHRDDALAGREVAALLKRLRGSPPRERQAPAWPDDAGQRLAGTVSVRSGNPSASAQETIRGAAVAPAHADTPEPGWSLAVPGSASGHLPLVLDAGCGTGRHLAHLRAAGLRAIGFDFSSHLLAVASRRPVTAGAVARADLRLPPFPEASFSAIFLLFTVFGYFDDDTNAAVLGRLARLLEPGGWLVLDLPDPVRLRATLVPESQRPGRDGAIIHERRRLAGTRVEKDVTIRRGAEMLATWRESVRIYERAEIDALARTSGLSPDPQPDPGDGGGRMVHWLRRG